MKRSNRLMFVGLCLVQATIILIVAYFFGAFDKDESDTYIVTPAFSVSTDLAVEDLSVIIISGDKSSGDTSEAATAASTEPGEVKPSEDFVVSRGATNQGLLTDPSDIDLKLTEGFNGKYTFSYDDETFDVLYTKENWKVINSYKINKVEDITIICQALIDEHPIHGSDMQSYRTADDMAYEWVQHNIAYMFLPDDNPWKQKVKDVDLNPADQGKSFEEIYKDRTGKDFNIEEFMGG